MTLPAVDVVVVGAGAAGGIVAEQLALAGHRVALLERGKRLRFADTGHDELRSQRTTVLGNAFGPDDERYVREVIGADWRARAVLPSEGAYNNVAACVGGGTMSYGAMAWRYMEKDFRMKSDYGAPEGSTLEDWPITYHELEPFYVKAEWEIGVSGNAGANPFEGPRSKAYPMPALPLNTEATVLERAAKSLGLHPFPIPMAINSRAYQGRPACIACPHCVGFGCEVNAKNSTAVTAIPRAVATGQCELRTESIAKRIVVDTHGKATGVEYFQNGQLVEQPCRAVVVSCSATETPRLLFNSATKLFPAGLGNRYDWVGRNLQGHAYAGAYGLFERELFDGAGPAARVACCDFNHGLPDGLKGGGMLANEFIRLPYLFARQFVPPGAPQLGDRTQAVYAAVLQAVGVSEGAGAGDAGVRIARGIGAVAQGRVGHSDGAAERASARARSRGGTAHRGEGGGVAEGSGGHEDVAVDSGRGVERRTTSGGDVPDGERSEDVGGGPVLPHSRSGQRLGSGRQRPRE